MSHMQWSEFDMASNVTRARAWHCALTAKSTQSYVMPHKCDMATVSFLLAVDAFILIPPADMFKNRRVRLSIVSQADVSP